MQMVIGAVVFAAGTVFGVWMFLAGQNSQKNRTGQRFQDALLKTLEKSDGRKSG